MKTLGLFSIMLVVAALTWYSVAGQASTSAIPMALMLAGMFGGLGAGLLIAFKKTISVPLIVLYAGLEGVLVSGRSARYSSSVGPSRRTAVCCHVVHLAAMLLGYKSGLIKVTDRSRRIFGMAILGYVLFGLVNFVWRFMGHGSGFGFGGTGLMGIAYLCSVSPGVLLAGH